MIQTPPQKPSKAPVPDESLAETRIVAQEIVHFLEAIYHTASCLKNLPSNPIAQFCRKPQTELLLTQRVAPVLERVHKACSFLKTLYLFTSSDFPTFAIPTVLFGLFGALSGSILSTNASPSVPGTLLRIPTALALIWSNLLIFNMSNQRTPSSVAEDQVNKPTRPIPAGRITPERARQVNLLLVPAVLGLAWAARVGTETLLLTALQWMYNDLRGCDESLVLRNGLIAAGYALYSAIALAVMVGQTHAVASTGHQWLAVIALVMFATQHICDIKDAPGDRLRGRRSAPIVLGDGACRWSVAVPVMVCSALCPAFFGLGALPYVVTLSFGGLVAGRTLFLRRLEADRLTWKLWALWTCSLFALPLIASLGNRTAGIDAAMLWEAMMHYACPGHDCAERLNVLAISGVAMAVKGSSMVGRTGVDVERNMTAVSSISVEVVA